MEENTQEKNLVEKNNKNVFSRIKNFFKNLFSKKDNNQVETAENSSNTKENNEFKEYIKMTEDEETRLLDLQARYRRGEIGQNDLTEDQIDALCDLYDKQIEDLRKSIQIKEEKIAEHKKRKQHGIENNNA